MLRHDFTPIKELLKIFCPYEIRSRMAYCFGVLLDDKGLVKPVSSVRQSMTLPLLRIPYRENLEMTIYYWDIIFAIFFPENEKLGEEDRDRRSREDNMKYMLGALGEECMQKMDRLDSKVGLLVLGLLMMGLTPAETEEMTRCCLVRIWTKMVMQN